jgi:hypothetical protein
MTPPSADGTEVGSIGFRNVLGMDFVDGTLYGTTNDGDLIRINTATGQGTLVGRMNPAVAATGASSTANFLPGDFDGDGTITAADYDRWRANFGTTVTQRGTNGDGNANGVVDAADYVVWRNRFTPPAPAFSSFDAIPEPRTLVSGVVALLFLIPLRLRRRGFFI